MHGLKPVVLLEEESHAGSVDQDVCLTIPLPKLDWIQSIILNPNGWFPSVNIDDLRRTINLRRHSGSLRSRLGILKQPRVGWKPRKLKSPGVFLRPGPPPTGPARIRTAWGF